ncbi:hypothetical protein N356_gp014 [Cellulophaga phage phi14:2]|uniref:Uncharacterized protein n=1 Tax=Cellulophaga phage phi14:2 TaxID=1327990 RepID=R9ZZZ3_9CAUD|nr:hypothetical protein N356_gp014 [Cellulophaga phage phi14:2]AGO48904.1 hypothetical protein Phi14:2_gp026 [Cellulophaga phage phi14:2]
MAILNRMPRLYTPYQDKRNFKKLLNSNGDYSKIRVTFKFADGSEKEMEHDPDFYMNEGKPILLYRVVEKLNTLKHEFQAIEYSMQIVN